MSGQWIEKLYALISDNPFQKKILITNGFAQGHQWLEQACRSYGPILNTEVQTVESYVLARIKSEVAAQDLLYVSEDEIFWIVLQLLEQLSALDESYLPRTMLTPGVIQSFHNALSDLRHAGVTSSSLQPQYFDNLSKALFIKNLLTTYESYLVANKLIDFPGLLQLINHANNVDNIFICSEHLQLTYVEQRMLDLLSTNEPIIIPEEIGFTEEKSEFPVETATFFRATSVLAEVREVFRRLAKQSCRWDEVEVIISDYQLYVPIFYTMSLQYGIKCTFSKGISLQYTETGSAALLYLEWLESGFNVDHLLKGIKQGKITFPICNDNISLGSIIRELEQSGIGWGYKRYMMWIEKVKNGLDSDAQEFPLTKSEIVKQESQLALISFFEQLFVGTPVGDLSSPKEIIAGMVHYIRNYVHKLDMQEKLVAQAISDLVPMISITSTSLMNSQLAVQFVRVELEKIVTYSTSIPEEGMIHISSLQDGGQSGRKYTYMVGMDDSNWALSTKQDPILLDEEREQISEFLITSTQITNCLVTERTSRLGKIRGICTLSFASYDIVDNRESNPSYELLQLFRKKVGQPKADYSDIFKYLPGAIGYQSKTSIQLDETDLWLNHLITPQLQIKQGKDLVLATYSHIAEGENALHSRIHPLFSSYDGSVDTSEHSIDYVDHPDATYISVSKLELFGRCPLQYFYQEVLGVRVKEVSVYDQTRWLNAMQKGSLLHAIFYQYSSELLVRNGVMTHDFLLLQTLSEKVIQEYTELIPAPSTQIWQKECETIRQDVKIFYANEQGRTSTPKYLELELHQDAGFFQLKLSDDLTLPIKGFVDRVDEISPHQYKIIDYKSGGTKKYKDNEFFSGGTQLQHALYATATEQYLRESGLDQSAMIVESAYVFPTEKGMGNEIVRQQNRKDDLAKLIQHMLGAMREGVFPPTKDPMNCNWCDYQAVCDGQAESMKQTLKLEAEINAERLASIREVDSYA